MLRMVIVDTAVEGTRRFRRRHLMKAGTMMGQTNEVGLKGGEARFVWTGEVNGALVRVEEVMLVVTRVGEAMKAGVKRVQTLVVG